MSTAPTLLFTEALVLLGGAVVAAPIFRKLSLGTVLGYLAAGAVIGPLAHIITGAEEILSVAELGIVFLLFVIGLELKPSTLWKMRADIFGLGTAQVLVGGALLTGAALAFNLMDWRAAVVAGFGLSLSSTAFALQILNDRSDMNSRYGQRTFSVLLFQDLAIVPLLALISILGAQAAPAPGSLWIDIGVAVAATLAMIFAGRYVLNPLFQIMARTGAREVMIAAALFIVLGSAMLMQAVGLSMAMGAFLAGVMLAESSYRHELEADIEPFRGILQALFFMAVGLSVQFDVILDNLWLLAAAVPLIMLIKAGSIYGLCRLAGSDHDDAIRIAAILPQGGEFGFVLFTTAVSAGLFSSATASLMISIVTLTMALTPVVAALSSRLLTRRDQHEELDEDFDGAGSDVLMIGFSRFGQIAAQVLLASGRDVTIIDDSADRIRQAASFGFRIYFGDGTRLDMLRAAGIEKAKVVAICTQKREVTDRIVDLVAAEFPQARLFVRSYDRIHSLSLRARNVEYELRETVESGLTFGRKTIEALGVAEDMAADIEADIRRRDEERLRIQAVEGIRAGSHMLYNRPVQPEPLVKPKRGHDAERDEVKERDDAA
ncbi:monovalent cation:proton antiporter-2 (CPA2) family protein [Allorhizobium taibaishanense]|uniref:CPA2 family monovalent cation:H+ antiporter-2 n=1 Tax=Allorhizobium taibaishanense TaxID=887144 RepID=A0A1Q9AA74_9HYPH|nr:monovalent cation:proton antiporter-2 (CPA2) family protein [Allorhizobium taibaishanense]MBB4006934.1 CPA2 family monovalent cation:H+ antiporter-2 [Allorhizobium taibaishanense]OLP51764.1 potassium transporter TrkA [Allorhizobium taibaishanense]